MRLEKNSSLFINKKFKFLLFILLVLSPLITNSQILITEVMYNPEGDDSGREWIEAINLGESINVKTNKNGWRIFDGKNRILKGENFIWNKNEIIIFVQNINKFLSEYPNVKNKLIEASFYLKNKEGTIKIIDENKNVLAEFSYNSNLGGNGNGYSLIYENGQIIEGRTYKGSPGIYPEPTQRTEKQKENEDTLSTQAIIDLPTKTLESSIQINKSSEINSSSETKNKDQASSISQNSSIGTSSISEGKYTLLITEFLPNLKGKDEGEFVEIYNYGDEKIDLINVYLVIGNKKYKLYGEIQPKEYKVFYNTELNFNIKNSGDTLKLVDSKNNIIFSISYSGKSKEGKSFARDNSGNWKWANPSPAKENIFAMEDEILINKETNKGENLKSDSTNYENIENINSENLAQINKNYLSLNNLQVLIIGLFLSIILSIIFLLFFK